MTKKEILKYLYNLQEYYHRTMFEKEKQLQHLIQNMKGDDDIYDNDIYISVYNEYIEASNKYEVLFDVVNEIK